MRSVEEQSGAGTIEAGHPVIPVPNEPDYLTQVDSTALPGATPNELGTGLQWHQPAAGTTRVPNARELAAALQRHASALGLLRLGFCSAEPFTEARSHYLGWLQRGFQGEMSYLAVKPDRAEPRELFRDAKTLVVVALPYARKAALLPLRLRHSDAANAPELSGSVARYALGADYHDVLKRKLIELGDACANLVGRPVLARSCVDSAPLLERHAAALAGIGFTGKSTLSILPGFGSYFLLGELLLDVEIAPSAPLPGQCGACRACLDACPTQAFVDEYVLDARRCISYLTIEYRGVIPLELRAAIGTRIFGCDVCQEVCPFNASPKPKPSAAELAARAELELVDLTALLELTSSGYRRLVKGSALRRASRAQLARNAAIALGNSRNPRAATPLLRSGLAHPSALVRGHAAWALGELLATLHGELQVPPSADQGPEAPSAIAVRAALTALAALEPEAWVRAEANAAQARFA